MLRIRRDEREVAGREVLPLGPVLGDDGAAAGARVDDRILGPVVVDGGGGVGERRHEGGADGGGEVGDGALQMR